MAVLVTGGAGFLGSHLLERLLDDTEEQLVCLDNFNDFYSPERKRQNLGRLAASPRFHLVEGDLVDPAVVEGVFRRFSIAQVFHAAALAGIRPSVEDPLPYLKTNVEGTLALLETVRRYGVDRLVFVSSSSVYGNECAVPFREDAPLGRPASPYGVTKHAAEQLCLLYHTLHGMPVVVVRLFSVYGPRLRPDLALSVFARCIDQGRPLPLLGDGSQKRDFTYVGDVVNGLLAASRRDCVGEVINLGHNKPVAICRLIALLEQELGKPARIEPQPAHPGDLSVTCADLSKAIRLLGYRPQVSIEDGVREFVAWFRSRG